VQRDVLRHSATARTLSSETPRFAKVAELTSTQKAQRLIYKTLTMTSDRSIGGSGDERRSSAP
jgi:hypothetical protein